MMGENRGNVVKLEQDALGNVTKKIVNGEVVEESEYNEVGWLIQRRTPQFVVTYTHDAEGNVIATEFAETAPD